MQEDKSQAGVYVKNLLFQYSQNDPILHNLSLTIKPGERVALLGSTGTGKSTFMETLVGLKKALSGEIWIQGILLEQETLSQVHSQIGFCFQNPDDQLFMPTILEDITFGPLNYGLPLETAKEVAQNLLVKFGLEKYAHRSVYELSGGQKRLAALAAVLALKPEILILDEPTNGLDPLWRRNLAEIILQLPMQIILIASHDLNWVSKVTERALILQYGQIQVDTSTENILRDTSILESYDLPFNY
ncbi:MAG: ABC transporter ATP-binding protein [Trichodesmium sp. St16_bin4-tuft]|nr:ABC transporter ATP-binding protein [Trichodesmium sp. St4_bin8_1]MDE5072697.1 ABC transporter ATP-binding protein [Trichodesmium sp. St5_bin8]MDE5091718.1 ABC transporter ATP-binding protein [Trichodesmium sp. St18_bin3_1_1]MDE5099080.1 ABC transporter ATP-binding protein [Trichodesmium sp. St16_bin4-tuft]MDE5102994.1 ABC transporter ATP-binding protein [Trichodesmium sp. St19_bin2]